MKQVKNKTEELTLKVESALKEAFLVTGINRNIQKNQS